MIRLLILMTKESFKSMMLKKQRSFLALLGIVIGIGSVIAMISVGEIVKHQAIKQFEQLGTNIITIKKAYVYTNSGNLKKSKNITVNILKELKYLKVIDAYSAYINLNANITVAGKNLPNISAMGVTSSFFEINKLRLLKGRLLAPADKNTDNCVVGFNIFNMLRKKNEDYVVLNQHILNVVGYLNADSGVSIRSFNADNTVFLDINRAASFFKNPSVDQITIRVKNGITNKEAKKALARFFSLKKIKVSINSPDELIAQMEKQLRMFALLLGAIGSISLLVGGIGIMNVMLVSVSERRKEIGIKRAIGAKQIDIQIQFLLESLILTFFGGLIGIILGLLTSWSIAKFSHWEFIFSITSIIAGVAMSFIVGGFFGFYPARQASKLDPIQALRSE